MHDTWHIVYDSDFLQFSPRTLCGVHPASVPLGRLVSLEGLPYFVTFSKLGADDIVCPACALISLANDLETT
jgi:hypothetical protein